MTVADIIQKRRARWEAKEDLSADRVLVAAGIERILSDRSMIGEVQARPYLLIEAAFVIVDKRKKTVPFFFNEVQRDFLSVFERYGTAKPYYILKGRQQGFTSLITAMQLSYAIVRKNFAGMTVADSADNAMAIFNDRARAVYERLPAALLPHERFSSKKEFYFDLLNSSWRVSTATGNTGRSRTLNFVHFSEVAFYDCSLAEMQKGIGEALTEDAVCIYETTANGLGEAQRLWASGACHNLFYEWWRSGEYRCRDLSYLQTKDPWLTSRISLLRLRGLADEQIAWYCRKYASYLDKSTIRQEYPCTPEEAFVASGECVFDKDALSGRLLSSLPRGRCGYFTYRKRYEELRSPDGEVADTEWHIEEIAFCESPSGYIVLHEEPSVRQVGERRMRATYTLGGDTAGEGADFFTGKVICNADGRTVATLRIRHIDEDLYAEQMYCLGMYYNEATVAIETNYSAYPMRLLERKYAYPRLYYRERGDGMGGVRRIAGFETTAKTKPLIVANLVALMREEPQLECDRETLGEMLTFIRLPGGGYGAAAGMHDDLVMALAIAHYVKGGETCAWEEAGEAHPFLDTHFHTENTYSENGNYMNWEDG